LNGQVSERVTTLAINALRNNIQENQGSPEVILLIKLRDIFDLQFRATALKSVAMSSNTRTITATLNFHNFGTVSFHNIEGDRGSPKVVLYNKSRDIFLITFLLKTMIWINSFTTSDILLHPKHLHNYCSRYSITFLYFIILSFAGNHAILRNPNSHYF